MSISIIDITHIIWEPRYIAKLIWEKLFRLAEAEKFESLYEFLCDLAIIEKMLRNGVTTIYWKFDYTGRTDAVEYYMLNACVIRVDYVDKKITITEPK